MADETKTTTTDMALPSYPLARSILRDPSRFEFTQRVARLYSESTLVPQHLRGKIADCFIALQMADAMDEDPLMVMQNIYIVNARAGWSAQYMISRAHRSGKFNGPLRWRSEGTGDDLVVTCYADLAGVVEGARVEVPVSFAMAKADGWTRNEKYKSIPEQMLRWRSATWLIRLYCPEVMMGMPTADELEDTSGNGRANPWREPLIDATPPRPQMSTVTTAPLPDPPKEDPPTGGGGGRRRRSKQTAPENAPNPGENAPDPKTTPNDGENPQTKASEEDLSPQFVFSDAEGQLYQFTTMEQATAEYAEYLEAAAKQGQPALSAAWENGSTLIAALHKHNHEQVAETLANLYNQLHREISEDRSAQKVRDFFPPANGTDTAEEIDVLVPLGTLSIADWFPIARTRLKLMSDKELPPAKFREYRNVNAEPLSRMEEELPNWFGILDRAMTAGGG